MSSPTSPTSALAGARVVVTGSSGFIGTHLVARLASSGARVIGLDRAEPSRAAPDEYPSVEHRTVELTADGAATDLLADALGQADVVFHLAGRGGVRERGPAAAAAHDRDNVVAAARVLAAAPARTPVLVTSSSSVYGGARRVNGRIRPSHEDDGCRPASVYARAKIRVERLCAARRADGGAVVVVRPFTVVGPGQRPDMAISRWIEAARAGRPIQIFGSPEVRRDMTDVDRVVSAIIQLATTRAVDVVNVGTGTTVCLGDVVAAVVETVGRSRQIARSVEIVDAPSEDPDTTRADTRRLAATLGWVPTTEIADVVRRQVAALDHSMVVAAR